MKGMQAPEHDPVARPRHYTFGGIEVIEAIEAWGCDFVEGNIIKYVARWKHKDGVTDLRKAAWYLNRLIDREIKRVQAADAEAQSPLDVHSVDPSSDHSTRETSNKRFCT